MLLLLYNVRNNSYFHCFFSLSGELTLKVEPIWDLVEGQSVVIPIFVNGGTLLPSLELVKNEQNGNKKIDNTTDPGRITVTETRNGKSCFTINLPFSFEYSPAVFFARRRLYIDSYSIRARKVFAKYLMTGNL